MMSAIFFEAHVDLAHSLHGPADHFAALFGHAAGVARQLVGLLGIVGVLLDGAGDLFQAGRRLLQAGRLLLRPAGKLFGGGGQLLRGRGHAVGNRRDLHERLGEPAGDQPAENQRQQRRPR